MSGTAAGRAVAVVGAGPAGLAAARALLEHGLAATVIDEAAAPGGQYYKPFLAAPDVPRAHEIDDLHRQGADKAAVLPAGAVRGDALVWGLFPDRRLALYVDGRVELARPDAVVLAAGAVERVAAFPGWTLPGVMTAGAAQTLLSREGILVGRRFLLAGTGPLLLAIALELAEAGGEVVAVVEGSGLTEPARHLRDLVRQAGRVRQFVAYRRELQRRGIPVLTGHTVVRAEGDGHVRSAVVAPVDGEWRVQPGAETRYEVDTLCLHYGFAAELELVRLAGCDVAWDPARGGWHGVHDDGMRSSRAGIYLAGQVAGIGGADLAEATGRLAGLTVARDLGALDDGRYADLARRARDDAERARGFARMLNLVYSPGPGLADLVAPETVVCRCEEVRAAEVDHAVDQGQHTLNDLKRYTRCGMGFCQGRVCAQVLGPYVARKAGVAPEATGLFTSRLPVKPVPLGALAAMPDPEAGPAG